MTNELRKANKNFYIIKLLSIDSIHRNFIKYYF